MKFKNFLLSVTCLFILSGCSVTYNLDIDKEFNIKEEMISLATVESDKTDISNFSEIVPIDYYADDKASFEEKIDGVSYYKVTKDIENKNLKLNYTHSLDSFNKSLIARGCYEYVTAMQSENDFLLSTSKELLCFNKYDTLDEVAIVITSKYKLKETNADQIENHKYTWYINRSNYRDKNLYLKLDTTKFELSFWEKIINGDYLNIVTISILLFVLGLIIYFLIKRKGEKRDKI